MRNLYFLALLFAVGSPLIAQMSPIGTDEFTLTAVSTYSTGLFDEGAAEIVDYDPSSNRLYFTNANDNSLGILAVDQGGVLTLDTFVDLSAYGDGVNSVKVENGIVAVAVQAEAVDANGSVVLFDIDGDFIAAYEVGVLPDMLTFAANGQKILTANEGQPSDDYTLDPEGSISILDLSAGPGLATVTTLDFTAYNSLKDSLLAIGVRIFGPGATVAQDLEPEYISVVEGSNIAYVSLQENNALAVVDMASPAVIDIRPLGYKDHSLFGLDASNRDDSINITTHPILGMYQPDAIATYQTDGQTYILTANEGDARDYDGFSEEVRVEDLVLDSLAYPNADSLQADSILGRLRTTDVYGDTDGDGDIDQIYSYGARSFSIFDASGQLIFDSGEDFERITAAQLPDDFNSNNDENGSFDARSDDKGPEPEAITIAQRNGRTYALIGLERIGGIMVYDITDPATASFVSYTNNRNFGVDAQIGDSTNVAAGDLGVEDVIFIPAADSPTGMDMVVSANEVSGTITTFSVEGRPRAPLALRILHNNDGESKLVADTLADGTAFGGAARFSAVVDSLRQSTDLSTVTLSSGDNYLPGPAFNASLAQPDGRLLFDARVINTIGYDALVIGNHDFDFGPDILQRIIEETAPSDATFLSANLDFTAESGLQALVDEGRIAERKIVEREGQLIGFIGLTTPSLPTISSPGGVTVDSNLIGIVQQEVDELLAEEVNKIILISHLQSIEQELDLAGQLTDVDVIIAGGGDELLTNDSGNAIGGLEIFDSYPIDTTDATGDTVYVVTTPGEYRYVGNLIVEFDAAGRVIEIGDESDVVAVLGSNPRDAGLIAVEDSVIAYNDTLAANIVARTEVDLNGLRASIRTEETNQGNLIADAFLWFVDLIGGDEGVDTSGYIVAIQNGGGIRNDEVIPAGSEISELKTFDILPFSNLMSLTNPLSAERFVDAIENSVSAVEFTSGRFGQIAGFEFIYDASQPAGERVYELTLGDGTPVVRNYELVDGAPDVRVITNSFTAGGGDDYDEFPEVGFTNFGTSYQEALLGYLSAEDGLNGLVAADRYPAGGEGRIRELSTVSVGGLDFTDLGVDLFPNPFQQRFTLGYTLNEPATVSLGILSIDGRLLRSLDFSEQNAGTYRYPVEAASLPRGVYVLQLQLGDRVGIARLIKQ